MDVDSYSVAIPTITICICTFHFFNIEFTMEISSAVALHKNRAETVGMEPAVGRFARTAPTLGFRFDGMDDIPQSLRRHRRVGIGEIEDDSRWPQAIPENGQRILPPCFIPRCFDFKHGPSKRSILVRMTHVRCEASSATVARMGAFFPGSVKTNVSVNSKSGCFPALIPRSGKAN